MLSLSEIESFYPESLRTYKRFLLREYLQHKILELLFESPYATKLSFMGGTCLRIVHANQRFSEDLDFDNENLSSDDFKAIAELIEKRLLREGYEVEIRNVIRGAYHIKFSNLLFESGLSGHKEEKILIHLDTEPQNVTYDKEVVILNKFDVFTSIRTTPFDILLAQKLFTICNRKVPKGRDFYDVTFLLPRTQPNYGYLQQKMNAGSPSRLREIIMEVTDPLDFDELARDVQPFLFNSEDAKRVRLFRQYIRQVEL